jgi:hypothetical protein
LQGEQSMNAAQAGDLWAYDPATGDLTWKVRPSNRHAVGSVAGKTDRLGYRVVRFRGRDYLGHRIAWLIVHGQWPAAFIDHINGNPSDNRLSNLREATNAENVRNSKLRRDNTHGLKGVSLVKNRYFSRIAVNRQRIYLGCFRTPAEAHAAYVAAAAKFHGEFARVA